MRIALEILGSAAFLAGTALASWFDYVALTLEELSGPAGVAFGAGIAMGYLALMALVLGLVPMGGWIPGEPRDRFDLFLGAFLPAAAIAAVLVLRSWPLDLRGWDAHGFGASGSEANAAFLPWLHAGLLPLAWRLRPQRRAATAAGGP